MTAARPDARIVEMTWTCPECQARFVEPIYVERAEGGGIATVTTAAALAFALAHTDCKVPT